MFSVDSLHSLDSLPCSLGLRLTVLSTLSTAAMNPTITSSQGSASSAASLLDAPIDLTVQATSPSDSTSSLKPVPVANPANKSSLSKHRSLTVTTGRSSGKGPVEGGGGAGSSDGGQSKLRMQYMEGILGRLQKEKSAMEEEFGRQRKKFMSQMMDSETQLNLAKQSISKHVSQVEELNKSLAEKTKEVQRLQVALKKEGSVMRESFDADRVMYEEKISSLEKALKGDPDTLGVGKMKEGKRSRSPSPLVQQDSLESSMMKAAQDAKMLKSVVVPLENEIDMLKMQLKEAQQRLSVYEGNNSKQQQNPLIDLSSPTDQHQDDLFDSQTDKLLMQERAARHDLEMHTDSLNQQKQLLQEELKSNSIELEKVKEQLRLEQLSHAQLKQTWEDANIHFLEIQDQLKQEIEELKDPLSSNIATVKGGSEPSVEHRAETPLHNQEQPLLAAERTEPSIDFNSKPGSSKTQGSPDWKGIVAQLQRTVAELRDELTFKTKSCEEYEKQLQRVQEQLMLEIDGRDDQLDKLRDENKKLQACLLRERKLREDLRRTLFAEQEEMKTRVEQFQSQENKMKQKLKLVKEKFTESKHEVQKDMTRFSEERVRLHEQLDQAREEYSCLKDLQTVEIADYQERLKKAESAQMEAELNVAATMDELNRMMQNETQYQKHFSVLQQSQQERESALTQLSELNSKYELLKNKMEEAVNSKSSIEEKSKRFIEEQRKQIEDLHKAKDAAEQNSQKLQLQIATLKQNLESSEMVQKDFVELSQSLQVKLVQMEEDKQKVTGSN